MNQAQSFFLRNKAKKKLSRRKYNTVEFCCPNLIVTTYFSISYLSISDGFCFPEGSMRQQHISALTAYKMKIEMIRMVTTTPTTTAMAISISGDKCSAKEGTKKYVKVSIFFGSICGSNMIFLFCTLSACFQNCHVHQTWHQKFKSFRKKEHLIVLL